jgi:hypothetical protein
MLTETSACNTLLSISQVSPLESLARDDARLLNCCQFRLPSKVVGHMIIDADDKRVMQTDYLRP